MKSREQFKRIIMTVAALVILTLQTALFWYIWYKHFSDSIPLPFWRRGNWVVVGLYAIILIFFSKVYGALKIGYLRIAEVIYSQILSVLCVNAITYIQICLINRWFVNPLPLFYMSIGDIILIIIWAFLSKRIYMKLFPARNMLIVYGNYNINELVRKMNSRNDKYNITKSIAINAGIDKIIDLIKAYDAIVLCDIPSKERNLILKYCFEESIRAYITPKISDIILTGTEKIHLFDTPLLLSRNQGLSIEQKILKRIFDIILSIIMLIITMPVMLIISVAIKCYDGGPVFYRQKRYTIDKKVFSIYKFRSMTVDSERDGARLARKNDDRITPIGKILRNIHFDELPQLINVLLGEMSMVGPRPERPEINALYENSMPEFNMRLKVKAGLTGYAQVYGKYNTVPYDKLKLDLFYIENYSFWLDLKLILMTFKILFQKENTEGIDDNQITAEKLRK
ncbi:exopolysaccharide biosynthesis polyprenyl glycosylphosphotransferase [Diplocloster hominis]|uniref:exopolysaccharide biosynthesis polyprenyl glycosylphosphotransferase n=1 Tax=Diplocloster hominis TaxID=3079010 RepID=UPI0031B9D25A